MKDVVIREAQSNDHDSITALFQATWKYEGYPMSAKSLDSVESVIWYSAMSRQWVAIQKKRVVGHVAIRSAVGYQYGHEFAAAMGVPIENVSVIVRLAVHPMYQHAGIGRTLIERVRAEVNHVALDSLVEREGADGFYRSMGFISIGAVDHMVNDEHHLSTLWVDAVKTS